VTVLGQVPPLRELRHLPSGQGVAEALRHSADVVEVFRSITTNIELAVVDRPEPAIAVLSAAPGEGKSTITAGIALTTAMAGVHVLAVDASLRRPSLHVQLGQQFGGGMSRATEATVADAVQRTEVPNLSLLPAGVPDRHPADILTTALPATLAHASEHHLRVLIDCPPMDGAAETAMVAAMARNVVVVVDPRRTDVADLDALLSRLRAGGVDVIGVVLNRVGRGRRRTRTSYSQVLPARAPARSTPSRRTARV
jgi:capsular exopolysaccharide synthesis family protein